MSGLCLKLNADRQKEIDKTTLFTSILLAL